MQNALRSAGIKNTNQNPKLDVLGLSEAANRQFGCSHP